MKKHFITGVVVGGLIFGTVGAFAGQYVATENPFPVQLNGQGVSIEGYNIEGSTYFKLRDIADTIGGFDVGFDNDTIQLSKDGYKYTLNNDDENDDGLSYKVVEGDGKKYNVFKNKLTLSNGMVNVSGKTSLHILEDNMGTKYVGVTEISTAATQSGFYCDVFPSDKGVWTFEEWDSSTSHYEYVSEGDLFVDEDASDFYILLDDYTTKVAPTLEKYVEKYMH